MEAFAHFIDVLDGIVWGPIMMALILIYTDVPLLYS